MPGKRVAKAISSFLLFLSIFACDSGQPANTFQAVSHGIVEGIVSAEDANLPGVTLRLTGKASGTATTDASGTFRFTGLALGAYSVEVVTAPEDVEFESTLKHAVISNGRLAAKVDFRGSRKRDATVSGAVTAGGTGLEGVTVDLAGPEARGATTDAEGRYEFASLPRGSFSVTISGFDPFLYEFPTTQQTVQAKNGKVVEANFAGLLIPQVPDAPTGLGAVATGTTTVDLSWNDESDDEAGFELERKEGVEGAWSQVVMTGPEATGHQDTGLSPNTTYFYRVRACNGDGCSEFTAEVSVWTPDVPPEAPSGLAAVVMNAYRVDLAWSDGSSNEEGFEVERRLANQGTWARLDVTAPDATGFSDTAVDANTAYLYRVRACNGAGCSDYTNEAAATTPEVPPDAPSGLAAAATSATTADLVWDDGSDNETGFELERKSGPGNNWKLVAELSADVEAFADTGLNANKSYTYRIRACNPAGCSDHSNEASVSTPDVPPEAPSGLAAVATGSSTVDLTWTDQSDNESGFRLERKKGAGGSWAQIATPEADATSFGDTGLDPATEYLYRIRACNDDGCSAFSSEVPVTTNELPPEAPAGLAAAIGTGTAVNLSWTDQSHNEAEFRVERKEGAGGAWGQIAATGADAESYGDTGLPPNTNYFYRVVACNPAGCSAYSNEAEITTPNMPPAGPTDLEAAATGPTGIDLAWSDQSDNELEFRVERKQGVGGSWGQIGTTGPDVAGFGDTELQPGTTYFYRVQACNAAGCSGYSNEASGTTDAPSGHNLFISNLYITQATQTPNGAVPLVEGKAGYLRVFALASASNSFQPYVRVRFYSGGSLVHTETINPPGASVPTSVNESGLGYSWNVLVPGSLIQPGLAILADVDPSDLVAEADEADNHFPVDGSPAEMDVRTMPPFHVTFVPVKQSVNGLVGNVTGSNAGSFLNDSFERWPMVQADVDVHAEYVTDAEALESNNGNGAWGTVLSEVNSLRVAEGTGRYYYGVVKVSYGGGIAGMGYLGWPTAIGWDKLPSGSSIAAHEWGHNFNLHHAPGCGAGNPDPSYPHADGKIGVWGLDVATQTLKAPSTFYDLMSYCGPDWVSDYMYQKTLAFLEAHPSQGTPSAGPEPSLLVWGRMEGGRIVLEPAFEIVTAPVLPAQPGQYALEALDEGGSRLFSYSFEPLEVPDGQEGEGHFAFAVPLSSYDQGSLARLRVSGGGRSPASREARGGPRLAPSQEPQVSPLGGDQIELTWDGAAFPMVLIRDPATGDVISFARGGEIRLEVPSTEVELVFSDGVRSTGPMRRRVR